MLRGVSQPQKRNTGWFHLYAVPRIVRIRDRKENGGFQGLWGQEEWGVLVSRVQSSIFNNH